MGDTRFGAAPVWWTDSGLRPKSYSDRTSAAVAGGLWETRSVFQGVWEGAGGWAEVAAFHTLADLRSG